MRTLLTFLASYTAAAYPLPKLDVLILPASPLDFLTSEQASAQLGLLFLPRASLSADPARLTHLVATQLAKHFFHRHPTCRALADLSAETAYLLQQSPRRRVRLLRHHQQCYLAKGLTAYVAYLGLRSLQPHLPDLLRLEWALVRRLDDAYFFADSNVQNVYRAYELPRLSASSSLRRVKADLRTLLAARSLQLLLGRDRFRSLVRDCLAPSNQTTPILQHLETYAFNYHVLAGVRFGRVLSSWMVAGDEVVVEMERNYNKKSARLVLGGGASGGELYPVGWRSGVVATGGGAETKVAEVGVMRVSWVNQSLVEMEDMPGADRWIVGELRLHLAIFFSVQREISFFIERHENSAELSFVLVIVLFRRELFKEKLNF